MPDDSKRPLKVFLCHAHPDAEKVRALYARLKADGVDAWLDKENIIPGQDWEYEVRKAVRESDIVVVCLSKQFSQKGYRQNEVRIALEEASLQPEGEIFIIPARLEECNYLESLKRFHGVDLFDERGYEYLMRALRLRADKIGAVLQAKKGWLGGLTSPTKKPDTQKPKPVVKPQPTPEPEEPKPVPTQKPPRKWDTRMIAAIAGVVVIFAAIFGLPWNQWFVAAPDIATVTPTKGAIFIPPPQTVTFTPALPTKTNVPVLIPTFTPTQVIATPTPKTLKWDDVTVSLPQKPITLENANQIKLLATITSPYNAGYFVLSPTDEYIAFTVGVNVYTVGLLDGKTRYTFEGHKKGVSCIAISPNGRFLVSGSLGEIRVWNAETGTLIKVLEDVSSLHSCNQIAFSPDSTLLTADLSRYSPYVENIQSWKVSDWTLLNTLSYPEAKLLGMDISPVGTLLAVGTSDNSVLLWDIAEGKITKSFKEGNSDFSNVKFSSDGKLLVSVNKEGTLWVWDIESESLVSSFQNFGCWDISILGNNLLMCDLANKVFFWNFTSGELVSKFDYGDYNDYYDFSVTHDKALLVVSEYSSSKSKISLWGVP